MEGVEVDQADDRDMTAALTLIEMADAIRAAEWLPSSNDNKPFTKIGRDTSSVNVSFEKYSEVYGSRVIIYCGIHALKCKNLQILIALSCLHLTKESTIIFRAWRVYFLVLLVSRL